MSKATWLWWSSGKDSAWALDRLLDDPDHHVTGLVTTVDEREHRVRFQGTGIALLELQAAATGLPLHVIELPVPCTNDQYAGRVDALAEYAHDCEVATMAFGDIHLRDVRDWRDEFFDGLGFDTHYPLWERDSAALARAMVDGGLEAVVTCVDTRVLDPARLGHGFDHTWLDELPEGVDPCGENGEFHTFVTAGPMLHERLTVQLSESVPDGDFVVAEPVLSMPVDGTLDLHAIEPREVGDLVDDYLDACRAKGILQVRVVHGKGIGALRNTVHARLRRRHDVVDFALGGEAAGGWGATLVNLRAEESA